MAASPGPDTRWDGHRPVAARPLESGRRREHRRLARRRRRQDRADRRRAPGRRRSRSRPRACGNGPASGRGHADARPGLARRHHAASRPSLRLGGTGRATVDAPVERGVAVGDARVAKLDQVSASGVSLGAGQAEVRVRGRALDGELSFPARRLRAKAAGRLESGGVLTGSLELDDLALQPLLRELGSAAADHVEGRVSSRGELSIPLGQPASGRGVVRLTPDGLRLLGEPWASQGPIVLRWEGPRFLVERFRLDGPAGSLSATGALIGPENRGLSLALDNARLPGALAQLGRGAAQRRGAPRRRRPRADAARRAVARARGRGLGPRARRRRHRVQRPRRRRAGPARARARSVRDRRTRHAHRRCARPRRRDRGAPEPCALRRSRSAARR